MNAPLPGTEKLAALIAAKLQVAEILVRLGRRQQELIDGGEMDGLVKLLAAKQTVLQQMQVLDRQLEPFRDQDPERRAWATPTARAACQAQADRANALIAEALALEQRAETAMLSRRDAAAVALAAAQTASDARTAYAPLAGASTTLQVEG